MWIVGDFGEFALAKIKLVALAETAPTIRVVNK